MLVKELLVSEPLHLVLAEHALSGAVGVRAGDVVGSLHHLERDVLLHALQEGQVALKCVRVEITFVNDLFAK